LSSRVDHVYLGVPEARSHIRVGRTTRVFDTGNPITPPDPGRRERARARFGLEDRRPVVLVTGGSQGAVAINEAVAGWLDSGGGKGIAVLWATGRGSYPHYARFHHPPDIHVLDFLDPMADGYAVADLVVARGGMMTFAELCAWGLASILIPLPTSAADHQVRNARAMDRIGATRMLLQQDLTPARLGAEIHRLLTDHEARAEIARRAASRGKPEASREIVSHILTLFR
jgi:UDP-N-acetylglucosamine--N-acetylmuramyl-(pentapeptide) pyrophosphoryl-undecaprenol N-acetylglucosamine transferase